MLLYKELNYTKEVFDSLIFAKFLAIGQKSNVVKPHHLFVSLIFTSTLLKKLFNIKELFYIKPYKKNVLISFSKEILCLLNTLNFIEYPINTLVLFYFLLKKYPLLINNNLLSYFNFYELLNKIESLLLGFKSTIIIPNILTNIIELFPNNKIKIIGRDKEYNLCKQYLFGFNKLNLILIGQKGIGKKTIIHKIAKYTYKKHFIYINIYGLFKEIDNISLIVEELSKFILLNKNIVLVFDDIHLLIDKSIPKIDLFIHFFIWALKNKKITLISTTSLNGYKNILNIYPELEFLLYPIYINNLNNNQILKILYLYSKNLSKKYKCNISLDLLKEIIKLGKKFIYNLSFPLQGKNIINLIYSNLYFKQKFINKQDILLSISKLAKLPKELISNDSINSDKMLKLTSILKNRLFGQEKVIEKILTSLKKAFSGLKEDNKPIGSWLLCGPSGTGKTELVKSLSEAIFGSEKNLIRFDMSEFMEKHSISKLIGSPPGYIGFESGGLLTEAVKNKPFSIILFDEIEKANKDINNIMLQILDEGTLTDSKGQKISFSNTIVLYTSNLGCPTNLSDFKDFNKIDDNYKLFSNKVNKAIKSFFKPEFLNRLNDIILFNPINIHNLSCILNKFIIIFSKKLEDNGFNIKIELNYKAKLYFTKLAFNPLYGARPLKRLVERLIEKPIIEVLPSLSKKTQYIFSIFVDKITNNINYSFF